MFSHNFIKRCLPITLLLGIALCARSALGQGFTINFDEYGNGTVQFASGGVAPLQSLGNIQDPFDPQNGLFPLGYSLIGTIPGVVAQDGDVLLGEVNAAGPVSDLLRWTHGLLLVYSEKEAGEINPPPADVGLPTLFQANVLALIESGPETGPNGLFGYTPGANVPFNNPGFYPIPPGPAVYNFTSDYAVPEPASLALIGGLGALLLLRRRR